MAVSFSTMPQLSSIFAAYASISAFIMLIQAMLNQLVPRQVQQYFIEIFNRRFQPRRDCATIVVEERDGMSSNQVFTAAETYLCTKLRPNIDRLKISKRCKETGFSIRFAQCEKIPDRFEEIELEWRFVNLERKKASEQIDDDSGRLMLESEERFFELCFDKKHKQKVLDLYLPFVMERAKSIRDERKIVKLHTLSGGGSSYSVNLEHPSTFNTLAMEPGLKNSIIEDLDRFVRRKDFYRKVGRAWKRGYLLYGPPGTGKSSLIAAMANYLKFDIYDLELTNISRDSDLRKLLLRTDNRSILVIEDIDCTVELPDRKAKMAGSSDGRGHCQRPRDQQFTLSGLLNFIDGLWSSCGDERIIIFTTNNKDRLDPALLRPGRMDMHIHMSYLTPDGFKHLASTYLNVREHHPGLLEVEALIKELKVTPAQVAEELMKSDDADASLHGLIDFLRKRKRKIERKNAKKGRRVDDGDVGEVKLGNGVVVDDESDGEIVIQNG